MSDLAKQIADALVPELGPKLLEYFKQTGAIYNDPLLTVKEVGQQLRLSPSAVRFLVTSSVLKRAPGLRDMRIRQSVVNAYGTNGKAAK